MVPALQKTGWPNILGVDEHIARTGERAPHEWAGSPVDMIAHGGYGVRLADGSHLGPWCWVENAEAEAGRHAGGRVLRWRDCHRTSVAGGIPAAATRGIIRESKRDEACEYIGAIFGVSREAILSRTRTVTVALARQAAMALFFSDGFSPYEIGLAFSRDRGAVLHAVAVIATMREHGTSQRRNQLDLVFSYAPGEIARAS